jgi:predicted Zn-dependent protease
MAFWKKFADWQLRRSSLKELRRFDLDKNLVDSARLSERLGEVAALLKAGALDEAKAAIYQAKAAYPGLFSSSSEAMLLLIEMKDLSQAESLLGLSIKNRPHDRGLRLVQAKLAEAQSNDEEAIRLWRAMRKDGLYRREDYKDETEALVRLGRLDEADKLLSEGAKAFPSYNVVLDLHARMAMKRHDWHEALRRWNNGRPHIGMLSLVGAAQCLREMGRFEEADKILEEAIAEFDC